MRIPLTLFLILIWTFLILAPINAFAEDKTFSCRPVVAGMPKKDGSFYVEDISEKSTPILDIIPDNQFDYILLSYQSQHIFLKVFFLYDLHIFLYKSK